MSDKPTKLVPQRTRGPLDENIDIKLGKQVMAKSDSAVKDTQKILRSFRDAVRRFGDRKDVTAKRVSAAYERRKKAARARCVAVFTPDRDIGELPPIEDRKRRNRCRWNFQRFCKVYFPAMFNRPWSKDHLEAIKRIQTAVIEGGLFAMEMPHGSGKSSLCEAACLWATIYGHRRYVVLVTADKCSASSILENAKVELVWNDRLLADFPEVCMPIHIGRNAGRYAGQLFQGKHTNIRWASAEIILPTIEWSLASGAVIRAVGITGQFRGLTMKRPDGQRIRPDLVIIDDPQTHRSAHSAPLSAHRERILAGPILSLAGPGHRIAGVMLCTVICDGDTADNILDCDKHPEWAGERI